MKCDGKSCLKCELPQCIYDMPKEKKKKDKSAYMREYYRKKRQEKNKFCSECGKKCEGEMFRISKKNFCSKKCISKFLLQRNEKKITKVYV